MGGSPSLKKRLMHLSSKEVLGFEGATLMARILVIEDDDRLLDLFVRALERQGHEVVGASDGEVGLKKMRATPADVVVTDILMPEKDGLETIRDLRSSFPRSRVVAISGGGRGLDGDHCLKMALDFGAQRVLPKPLRISQLNEAIDQLLEV
jgi:DNA-binding response OmpR family regulator